MKYLECINHLLGPVHEHIRYCISSRTSHLKKFIAYQIVLVIAVPAIGARQLARMLYFRPSNATVRVRPRIPAFAVEY